MIIAISGTPGTGKTKVAELLAKELNANLFSINGIIRKYKIKCNYDKKRKTKIVDIKKVQSAVQKFCSTKINIIEGHLSHLLEADIIIILRSNPDVISKRLKKRNWTSNKINENIQAEILDTATLEALEKHNRKKIFEIDTSKLKTESSVQIIKKIINNSKSKKYTVGRIDWTEKYKHYLTKISFS